MEERLIKKLANIKLLAMDIDGTLSDGGMYYSKSGEELKRFYVRDGMGINLLQKNGILTAFITSEVNDIVTARAQKLKIDKVILGSWEKDLELKKIAEEFDITLDEIAFIGDDVNDIPAIKIAGFSACPKDAYHAVIPFVDYKCSRKGGKGAVRELADLILNAKNIFIP